jgi:hypothetical protein
MQQIGVAFVVGLHGSWVLQAHDSRNRTKRKKIKYVIENSGKTSFFPLAFGLSAGSSSII